MYAVGVSIVAGGLWKVKVKEDDKKREMWTRLMRFLCGKEEEERLLIEQAG